MKPFTICYFGIYNPEFSRNRIYIQGLRKNGVQVIECRSVLSSALKILGLWKKHWVIRDSYDVLVVGYPGHVVVPLARLISRKPVILDALGTLYEAEVLSHNAGWLKALKTRMIDWLAVRTAHVILVESESQKQYFIEKFGRRKKYEVVYTGADDSVLDTSKSVAPLKNFTVLFRGSLTPESGMPVILETVEIIEKHYPEEQIRFRIMGRGICENDVHEEIRRRDLKTVELITEKLPWPDLVRKMRECHISLGQFGDNPRLNRTIPHKAFESLALGIPYLSARTPATEEFLVDGENCVMCRVADPLDLAEKILLLKHDVALRAHVAEKGVTLYLENFKPAILGKRIMEVIYLRRKNAL
jgi:glycosyltransferase involved in cell wall biosynthesis